MEIKKIFNDWANSLDGKYTDKQWMLSKWENIDGIDWPKEKITLMLKNIGQRLDLKKEHVFVDLGCGGGWILEECKTFAGRSVGLDFSLFMLALGKKIYHSTDFICGDIAGLPFKDGSFDRALCYFVFINMLDEDVVKSSLKEIVRVLRKGGKALIGQIPDANKSDVFDNAKKDYIKACQQTYACKENLRDQCWVPIKLFERDKISKILDEMNVGYQICDSFNPFYLQGADVQINWRFDIVIEKK